MATPAKSVQFREADDLIEFYKREEIPGFAIKQGGSLNFKFEEEDIGEGAVYLKWLTDKMIANKSAAIYTLCLYSKFTEEITDKTPCSLSVNFRLSDYGDQMGYSNGSGGGMADQVRQLREEVRQLREGPDPGKLGIIGEIMELEPLQPLLMAIGARIADFVYPAKQVGELRRVSGIPGIPAAGSGTAWRENPIVSDALDRLSLKVEDVPNLLKRLADLADDKPGSFKMYLGMFMRM